MAALSASVTGDLRARLSRAGLDAAIGDLRAAWKRHLLTQPRWLLRNGWKLDPDIDPGREGPVRYYLGHLHAGQDRPLVGQVLTLHARRKWARLATVWGKHLQVIGLDLETGQVLENETYAESTG